MSQRGYQGGPPKDYQEGFGQGGQGKRSWRQPGQQHQYSQQKGDYYYEDQGGGDPNWSGYRGYQEQYEEPYYYPSEEKSGWGHQEYDDQYGGYYQDQGYYHQPGDYQHHKKKGPMPGTGQKGNFQQKPYKKGYPPQQQQPPKKYPQDQGSYGKGSYKDHSVHQNPQSHQDSFAQSHKDRSSGPHQKTQNPQAPSQKGSVEDKQLSGRKASNQLESQALTGSQGAIRPTFGQYYTQKRYQEQEQLKKLQQAQMQVDPTDSQNSSVQQLPHQTGGKAQTGISAPSKVETGEQTQAKETVSQSVINNEIEDERFSKTMAKFNTLDRGTYFVREDNKKAHFLVAGRADLLGWKDTYVINGYLLHGVVLKLLTLTSRIFLFVENLHSLYHQFVRIAEDGETVLWTDAMPDKVQIVTVTNIEKVEVLDNDEEGFEGFVCYTICEDSKIEFNHTHEEVEDWHYVQELILLYEPTSIRKIYLDVVYNSIYKPESKGFGGKRIAAIVNPHVPGETIQYNKKVIKALDKECVVGTIWIQNGRYTLIAETVEDMERLIKLVEMALDIAEELNAYVMITNLRRTFDYIGKTVLYISSDPTLKLIRSSNAINFANKIKKSENLT